MCNVNFEWVNMITSDIFVSGPKFTIFLHSMREIPEFITPFTACWRLYPFQKYWRLKSKVFLNHAKFWIFLPSQILKGSVPQKLYQHYHAYLAARHMTKFRWPTPPTTDVICDHSLNFKPIFDPPPLWKTVRKTSIPSGGFTRKTW